MKTSRILDHPIDKIEGLTDPDRTVLKSAHIEFAEDFWAKMAGDPALIDSLSFLDNAAKKRLVEAMSQFAKKRSDSITQHPLIVHIPDVIVVVAFVLVGYSLFFLDRTPVKPEISMQVVVTAPNGLAPFHVLKVSDVDILDSAKNASALTSVQDVTGRYAIEHIAKGTVIDQSRLSSGPRLSTELDGLRVVNVKLQSSTLLVNLKLPVKIGIIPSAREKDAGRKPKIYEVYLLEAHPQGDGISAVVATTTADCLTLVSLLGRADLVPVGLVH